MRTLNLLPPDLAQHSMPPKKVVIPVLLATMFTAFSYGVLVGSYHLPPYHQIASLKRFLLGGDQRPNNTHYFDKKSFFEVNGKDHYEIVFIGDSITEWSDWYELFPHQRVANRGIAGDTAAGISQRLDSIVATKASTAFIMVGINDLFRNTSVDAIIEHYAKIVDTLIADEMTIVIQSTLYLGKTGSAEQAAITAQITQLNERLEALSKQHEQVTYIDLNARLSKNKQLISHFTHDGLHLNGQAYAVWRDAILPLIDK